MALKSFKELYSLDLSKHIQKKPTFQKVDGKLVKTDKKYWLDYIEWSTIIFLLYDNGAEKVIPEFETDEKGYPAFFNNGKNPFIKVKLTIDDKVYNYHYPVIDGNRVDEIPNQMSIHKAQQRGLVKCVAVNTGLGLSLWQKEEHTFDSMEPVVNNNTSLPELIPGTPKWTEAIKSLKNGFTLAQIAKKYYVSPENQDLLCNESI
jgi:hypothetical protein